VLAALAVAWGALLTAQQAYAYATSSPRFEVRALLFQSTPHLDEAALRERLGLQPGTNILAVDTDELAARIAAHPWVRSATVTRQLPDALIVAVDEHASVAVLHAGRFFLVDREGRPFKELEPGERGELPVITGVTAQELLATAGDPHPRVQRALAALEAYQAKRRPRLGEVHVGPNGELDLYTAELGTRLRLGRGEVAPRLERFDALRAALGPAAERLAVVHLDATLAPGRPDRVVASFFDGPSGAPDDDDLPARDPTP
jgi:cell division protein FtsQ